MEKKRFLLYILISYILLQGVLIFLLPAATANSIPSEYYQQLDLNGKYIYNVTQFNGPINWLGFDYKSKYNASTNAGGQIIVNFTGFYDKDPNDIYNEFQNPMPYMDVEFVEKFPRIVSLAELKANPQLDGMPVIKRGQRLSIQPVDKEHFEIVVKMAQQNKTTF